MLLSRAKRLSPAPVFFLRLRLHLVGAVSGIQRRISDVDVDVEEFRAQTIVSMPVLDIQFTLIIN